MSVRDCQKLLAYLAAGVAQLVAAGTLHGNVLHAAQLVAFAAGALAVYQVPPAGAPRPVEGVSHLVADFLALWRTSSKSPARVTSGSTPAAATDPATEPPHAPDERLTMFTLNLSGQLPSAAAEANLIAAVNAITADPANGCTGAGGSFSYTGEVSFTLPVAQVSPAQSAAAALQDILAQTASLANAQAIAADVNQVAGAVATLSGPTAQAAPAPAAALPAFAQPFQLPAAVPAPTHNVAL